VFFEQTDDPRLVPTAPGGGHDHLERSDVPVTFPCCTQQTDRRTLKADPHGIDAKTLADLQEGCAISVVLSSMRAVIETGVRPSQRPAGLAEEPLDMTVIDKWDIGAVRRQRQR
jgi:hypothetical protein